MILNDNNWHLNHHTKKRPIRPDSKTCAYLIMDKYQIFMSNSRKKENKEHC